MLKLLLLTLLFLLLLDLVLSKLLTQQGQGKLALHKQQNQMLKQLDLVSNQDHLLNQLLN